MSTSRCPTCGGTGTVPDRCPASVFISPCAARCRLLRGHAGPHETLVDFGRTIASWSETVEGARVDIAYRDS